MVYCAAVGCDNNTFKKNRKLNISFFSLPRDEDLKKKWITNVKRKILPKEENIRICHEHFEESCFKRDLQVCNINIVNLLFLLFFNLIPLFYK